MINNKIITSIFFCLLLSVCSQAQRFQTTLDSDNNVLSVTLTVVDENFVDLELGQIEFFIRTSSNSEAIVSEILVDRTNFPGNIPLKVISDYTKDEYRYIHFGYSLVPSIIKRDYFKNSSYNLVKISLDNVVNDELFELVSDLETFETYLNLTSAKGEDLVKLEDLDYEEFGESFFVGKLQQNEKKLHTQGTRIRLPETFNIDLFDIKNSTAINLHPNPTAEIVNLQIDANTSESVELYIQNINGKKVLSKKVNLEKGINKLSWDLRNLSNGNYLLSVDGQNIRESYQFTIIE